MSPTPNRRRLVCNTGPLLALIAATGDLKILQSLYDRVVVPFEVATEIGPANSGRFGAAEFATASWLEIWNKPTLVSAFYRNALDVGEASVIQVAMDEGIETVCIDEEMGRRVARLSGLQVTGSLGILIRSKREGMPLSLAAAIQKMRERGVWISAKLVRLVLDEYER